MKTFRLQNPIGMILFVLALFAGTAFIACSSDSSQSEDETEVTTDDSMADDMDDKADATEDSDDSAAGAAAATTASYSAKEVTHKDMTHHVTEDKKVISYHHEQPTYHPVALVAITEDVESDEMSAAEAARKAWEARPFDVPPYFGEKCPESEAPKQCSHDEVAKFLSSRIELPDETAGLEQHREVVTFVVKADGSIDESNILFVPQEQTCHKCAAEALRLVKAMPDWVPAKKDGQPVDARVTIPIRFHEAG